MIDEDSGEVGSIPRLVSTGIYNDPNDLCLIISTTIVVCLYFMGNPRTGVMRVLWLAPIGLLLYAMTLTRSRGGLLGLSAGLLTFSYLRFGWKKTLGLAMVAAPVVMTVFAGRQLNISLGRNDTAYARVEIWSEGLQLFKEAPLFGIGSNQYAEYVSHVAHNSFVHCFTELGLFGGSAFIGAFYVAALSLWRLRRRAAAIPDPEMRRLLPYQAAILAAYIVGMLSLSRAYVIPTYMMLGLPTVYLELAALEQPSVIPRFDRQLLQRMIMVSGMVLVATYVFIRVVAR